VLSFRAERGICSWLSFTEEAADPSSGQTSAFARDDTVAVVGAVGGHGSRSGTALLGGCPTCRAPTDELACGCRFGATALLVAWGTSRNACATWDESVAMVLCIAFASEAKAAGSRFAMARARAAGCAIAFFQ
jgi:hypothetical protein